MEAQIKSLENKIENLTHRLERVESALHLASPAPRPVNPTPANTTKSSSEKIIATTFDLPSIGTSRLLALVAVICFVLAGGFIIKLAIESGWLTAERQWASALLLGLSLCGFGRYFDRIEKNYRAYLSAAGIIILYLASYSSFLYFEILAAPLSLALGACTSLLALALFHFHKSEIFAILAVVGTYLGILLLGKAFTDIWLDSAYILLWAAIFSWFSTRFESRLVSLVAAYHGLGLFAYLYASETSSDALLLILGVQALQFCIFAIGVVQYSVLHQKKLSRAEAAAYFPLLCFFYGVSYHALNRLAPSLAPWIALIFASALLAAYQGTKKQLQMLDLSASQEMVNGFFAIVLFQAGYLELLPANTKPWLLPIFLVASYLAEQKKDFPKAAKIFQFLGIAISFFEFLKICSSLLDGSFANLPVAIVTIAIGFFYYLSRAKLIENRAIGFLTVINALAILALYRLAYPYGSLYVSLAWGIYSVIILAIGYIQKDISLARSSLLVLLAASLKAFLYDASQATTGVRIICLLLTGLLLYGTGYLFQKMASWKNIKQ